MVSSDDTTSTTMEVDLPLSFVDRAVVRVHQQVADAGAEVKQEGPRQNEHDELDDEVGEEALKTSKLSSEVRL